MAFVGKISESELVCGCLRDIVELGACPVCIDVDIVLAAVESCFPLSF